MGKRLADNRTGSTLFEARVAEFLGLAHNVNQRGGKTPDFTGPDGATYELKCDKYALRSNSPTFFAEVAETKDNWVSSKPSGIATQPCDSFLLVAPGGQLLEVPAAALRDLLTTGTFPSRSTRAYINGNTTGRGAKGVLVPWAALKEIASTVHALPAGLDPLAPEFGVRGVA